MSIENNRERTDVTAALHLDLEATGRTQARGKNQDKNKENKSKQRDKASLSASLSHVRVEVRGSLRSETNLWRNYGSAASFLYFHDDQSLPAACVCGPRFRESTCFCLIEGVFKGWNHCCARGACVLMRRRSKDSNAVFKSSSAALIASFH
jgi:hypothetical protein